MKATGVGACCGLVGGFRVKEGAEEDEFVEDVAEIVFDPLGCGGVEEDHEAVFAFAHLIDEEPEGGGFGLERIAGVVGGLGAGFLGAGFLGAGFLGAGFLGQHYAISIRVHHFR
jgi:hypothetical protein